MSAKQIIDISQWERKEHYAFFGQMPDPYFGLTAKVDFTECYRQAKAEKGSFFLYSLHAILSAMNAIPEFRCRIEDEQVVRYDAIGASPTIAREDGTFGFAYFDWDEDRAAFVASALDEIERVKNGTGLSFTDDEVRSDIIYFTSIPWVDFTDIKHAGGHRPGDSIPEVAVGKLHDEGGRKMMSLSVQANHGLADARHVGLLLEKLSGRYPIPSHG